MKYIKKPIKIKNINLKNAGFIVPNDYFENLETQVFLKLTNDIPTDYFKNVESKILTKLNFENYNEVKIIKLKPRFLIRLLPYAAVASIALFIGLNFINKANKVTIDTLEITNINNYLALEPDYSNSYNLGELLNEEDFLTLSKTSAPLENSNLESYLNQTNVEELLINNQQQ